MEWIYIIAACLFIVGLKMLGSPVTARRGNFISAVGMLLAIVATLLQQGIVNYGWIVAGLAVGSIIGAYAARTVEVKAMPEFVALFNGFGGLASLLVGWAEYHMRPGPEKFTATAIYLAALIGGITFTGSMIAFAKLAERMSGKPIVFSAQQVVNGALVALAVVLGVVFVLHPGSSYVVFLIAVVVSFVLGVLAVLPIGGADMPVVISLLNSYSGLAAAAAGFVISNTVLIVAGSLVGASGIILTNIMCKAMNRSIANVLFSGFGSPTTGSGTVSEGTMREINIDDAAIQLGYARQVVFAPGYGMATAQAQHAVRELGDVLEARGVTVKYGIHPVAGRMPGHMNVLLAEASVPYSQLFEADAINPEFPNTDVAVIIGANDVVNPDARDNPGSPIAGMPILEVDLAKSVIVLKRGQGRGFSGLENPLFFKPNTGMLYGDAKESIMRLISAVRSA